MTTTERHDVERGPRAEGTAVVEGRVVAEATVVAPVGTVRTRH